MKNQMHVTTRDFKIVVTNQGIAFIKIKIIGNCENFYKNKSAKVNQLCENNSTMDYWLNKNANHFLKGIK